MGAMTLRSILPSAGSGFGLGGDDHVRFALIENEQRIAHGVRGIRRALSELG
jgi:alanine-synthesizing transaminase